MEFEKLICGVVILDENYIIVEYNKKASEITEYLFFEIIKVGLESLNDKFYTKLYNNLKEKDFSPINDVMPIVTKNSKEKFIKRNIDYIVEDEKLKNIIISFIDITEFKMQEQNYFHFQKFESLGEISKAISLEYNNLLAAILGFSSFLKSMINPSNEMYGYLDIIENSAAKASGLTNQFMSLAGTNYFKQTYVDFNKIIFQNVDLLQKTLPSNIKIHFNSPIENLFIYWDENQLNQIVINTILNAKEAIEVTKKGGVIVIETFVENNFIKYLITDNGIGIKKEIADKIFEPYFTTKEVSKHVGLGLSVTEGIAKNMGGGMSCSSKNGNTIFTIVIPYQQIDINKLKMLDLFGNNQKILVVDDVYAMRNLASVLLTQKNYQPITADSGKEALEILKTTNVDLVLLDVMMPEMNGEEVFIEIRKTHPALPVIFLTGYTEENIVRHLIKNDKTEIIIKPFETYDFFNKIHNVIDRN
ncbi:MAG: hypothetical protein A2086_05680 [Spirochaetes bacterium GWD1_27_9]|nr:MAG: hypothetical protein A2Y34_08685 [Spirochaetes bacterium GWC1_27_15]OHD37629.1 MAG: hypothetical protein A2086_05680 [Spirochaetes bacterium GWD1_27_9]